MWGASIACAWQPSLSCTLLPGMQSYEALKDHLKSDAVKEFIKFTAKEKIPIFTTPVYVIE